MKNEKFYIKLFFAFLLISTIWADEPKQWGENVSGVATRFNTLKKEIALTFDACGGSIKSSQYDEKLINFLIENNIKATLFLNARWIKSNPQAFKKLQQNNLFELENHGTEHKPLSINGKMAYGQIGTKSEEEVIKEVEENNKVFQNLTQKRPLFFRSGTAYYDEIAVDTVKKKLNMQIMGFSLITDAGATLNEFEIFNRVSNAKKGDILIAHMNHPESQTSSGIKKGLQNLINKGFTFVKLTDIKKQLVYVK